jgi:transcription termination factor Rho
MNDRRRPTRRGRGQRPQNRKPLDSGAEPSPYRDDGSLPDTEGSEGTNSSGATGAEIDAATPRPDAGRDGRYNNNGRRGRRGRSRNGPRSERAPRAPAVPIVPDGEVEGWFDSARDGGFIRRAAASYLPTPGDAFVPPHLTRQFALRRGDKVEASVGPDHRGRVTVAEIQRVNGVEPGLATRRPDFSSLTASYPERKLTLETGQPAKGGPELTRRAIDLIAPIGYGQRALIVAPARAGKTMLLQAITEGIAINHPNATLLVLLVDERPEEVSEMISWGRGEVVASSFDEPAERHVDVADMVLERARRLVETGKDVVIVLDSLTRLARAHNTAERGTGRTLSGGLDATAMAKPKAFFGSARAVPDGGSLTSIATALVETGSRMDDVIFEEFKGTGNCEIKLDRSLAEKRIYPAIDIATSGTRREEKLFAPDQRDAVYTLRRGLQQMPPQAAMEWLIKRIAATTNNDALLAGL